MYGHVITKFSRMGRLLHFLTHGAPLRESAAKSGLRRKLILHLSVSLPVLKSCQPVMGIFRHEIVPTSLVPSHRQSVC